MNKEQVLDVLKRCKGAYGTRFEINENTFDVWFEMLQHEPYEMALKRLNKHIATSRFEPTISALLPSDEEKQQQHREHLIRLSMESGRRNDDEHNPSNL